MVKSLKKIPQKLALFLKTTIVEFMTKLEMLPVRGKYRVPEKQKQKHHQHVNTKL